MNVNENSDKSLWKRVISVKVETWLRTQRIIKENNGCLQNWLKIGDIIGGKSHEGKIIFI